jgi:flagellar basal-body rod protein FlgC
LVDKESTNSGFQHVGGVKVDKIVDDQTPVRKLFSPGNPLADKDGFVFSSNVSEVTEMVEMMAAARSYQNNVEVVNTARELMMRTLDIIKA